MKCIKVVGKWGRNHDWNMWEHYIRHMINITTKVEYKENWQKRTCKICGFEQSEKIDG